MGALPKRFESRSESRSGARSQGKGKRNVGGRIQARHIASPGRHRRFRELSAGPGTAGGAGAAPCPPRAPPPAVRRFPGRRALPGAGSRGAGARPLAGRREIAARTAVRRKCPGFPRRSHDPVLGPVLRPGPGPVPACGRERRRTRILRSRHRRGMRPESAPCPVGGESGRPFSVFPGARTPARPGPVRCGNPGSDRRQPRAHREALTEMTPDRGRPPGRTTDTPPGRVRPPRRPRLRPAGRR